MTFGDVDRKIMLLDDEPFMLKLLQQVLANLGYLRVTAFSNGQSALAAFDQENGQPDMILLDLNMPKMDGLEFVRHLVKRNFTGILILISGEGERMLEATVKLVSAHGIGILGHLHKPFKPDELKALLVKRVEPNARHRASDRNAYSPAELRQGMASGELENYYQPKVDVASGRVVGVEALVRWIHPQDGIVYPDQFITVAEQHGLMDDLTHGVLVRAMNHVRQWGDERLDLRVSVNVSMVNMVALDFPDRVAELASRAGVMPSSVMLELTESQLMQDLRAPLEVLTRLRLKRFGLSIDDFGTGHSSLAQLRDFPFHELKIDRSFVHGASNSVTLRAIYDASLALARELGMQVVAEGVSEKADWDLLCETGCDLAQGYFVARPMSADELGRWTEDWGHRFASSLAHAGKVANDI